ncbi:MAG: hypothetical protein CM1200mP10_24260 [Candidatus Neomarinimicrobiota bacterium]|nr:MAG: hypothetical protein CM1200mP10_24260 [Candidatus Neomarinimicrobiota bacterium]
MIKFKNILILVWFFSFSRDNVKLTRASAQDILYVTERERKKGSHDKCMGNLVKSLYGGVSVCSKFREKYNQDLRVIFVSADWLDEEKQVKDFLKFNGCERSILY